MFYLAQSVISHSPTLPVTTTRLSVLDLAQSAHTG
jgi:hypothetical protein